MHIRARAGLDGVFAALGSAVRLKLLGILAGGERCICEIAPEFAQERSVLSRHLGVLERAGLVTSRREGRRVIYRIADPRVLKLIELALEMLEKPMGDGGSGDAGGLRKEAGDEGTG